MDFLPRLAFLGAVVAAAHGAEQARAELIKEIETARFTLLPGERYLGVNGKRDKPGLAVQPDGLIESIANFTIVEAKAFAGVPSSGSSLPASMYWRCGMPGCARRCCS